MLTHDRDEELSLFLEMRRRENEHIGESLLTGSGDNISINGALTNAALSGISETVSSQRYPLRRTAAENFLYSEREKSDYDWLLTPPGTPQFEKESLRSVMNQQLDAPDSRPTVVKSRLGNSREEMISGNNTKTQMSFSSEPSSSSVAGLRRPSSSGSSRSTSRPSTPTRRSTTTSTSTTKPVTTRASTSRSSTPTSRATLTAARATTSTGSARSATPTRSKTRPSSAPSKKPVSSPATPTRRPSTPTGPSLVSSKPRSRGASPSPTVKPSKPWKQPEMPGFSLDAPPNLRTSRPVSYSRGRPGVASAPGSRSSSIERGSVPTNSGVGHSRRQSCSPSRGRAPIGNTNGSLPGARGRGKANKGGSSCDGSSPVAMGNKSVERVVNMRKLGPPRLTENAGRGTAKSSSAFTSRGYGRSLSKSSIDMALRHLDIRRGMTGSLRPLVTKVPASSMYSVRPTSVTNSPVATSSTVSSSEPSLDNINILCLDGNDAENDDLLSERSFSSPRDQFPKFTC